MGRSNAEEKLLDFLDRKAFEPVLKASPGDYSKESEKEKLEHVQRATRSEQERYRRYGSAKKIRDNFRDDLSSDPAKEVQRELHDLGLPTLRDLEPEFDKLCENVGVGR